MVINDSLTLAPIFQSNMVLQRDKAIVIWGNGPVQSIITVNLFHGEDKANCKIINNNGKWQCTLPAQKAGTGYKLVVCCNDEDTIVLDHISIGEVWLAGGQSNMEFFLRYDADWENVRNYDNNPSIHMYNVPQTAFEGHQRYSDGYGVWFQEKELGFETFSAPAYSFARHIQPIINVPIGIIGCNWGGTTASAWLDESCLLEEPLTVYLDEYKSAISDYSMDELKGISLTAWEFEDSEKHREDFKPVMYGRDEMWQKEYMEKHKEDPIIPMGPWNINRPGGLYHLMLEPLIPFSIKGVLWYQGETDAGHADIYDKLLTSLINCWRNKWNDNFPFLFVQLAPFQKWLEYDATGYPDFRQKQELVSKTIDNTAMISIMDIGSYYDVHPKQKMEVGRRLALLARGKIYGEDILCESPEFEKGTREGNKIILSFLHCENPQDNNELLFVENPDKINGFQVTQNNKSIPILSISIEENTIILETENLEDSSCTVSFAWTNYVEVNVFNAAGLPIKPFKCTI